VAENAGGTGGSCPTGFTCTNIADYSIIVSTNNFFDADAVDADGDLTGANLTSHGPDSATPKGHMLGDDATDTTPRFRLKIRKDEIAALLLVPLVWRRRRHGGRTT